MVEYGVGTETMPITIDQHIEVAPSIRGGKPCIAGTRIAVSDVVLMHLRLGQSLEQIAGHYDIPLAALHAAMAYYYDHQNEIDQAIDEEDSTFQAFRDANPSLLQAKLRYWNVGYSTH
jgi:uncharacterized protein (DUF433 family)